MILGLVVLHILALHEVGVPLDCGELGSPGCPSRLHFEPALGERQPGGSAGGLQRRGVGVGKQRVRDGGERLRELADHHLLSCGDGRPLASQLRQLRAVAA